MRRWMPLVVAVAIFAAAVAIAGGRDDSDATGPVPNVVGVDSLEAQRILQEAGFHLISTDYVAGDAPPGTVISQSPVAGTRVEEATRITLQVVASNQSTTPSAPTPSPTPSPPTLLTVPNVEGLSAPEAADLLGSYRISWTTGGAGDHPGAVLEQEPAAGEQVPEGTKVALTLAQPSGPYEFDLRTSVTGTRLEVSLTTNLPAGALVDLYAYRRNRFCGESEIRTFMDAAPSETLTVSGSGSETVTFDVRTHDARLVQFSRASGQCIEPLDQVELVATFDPRRDDTPQPPWVKALIDSVGSQLESSPAADLFGAQNASARRWRLDLRPPVEVPFSS